MNSYRNIPNKQNIQNFDGARNSLAASRNKKMFESMEPNLKISPEKRESINKSPLKYGAMDLLNASNIGANMPIKNKRNGGLTET